MDGIEGEDYEEAPVNLPSILSAEAQADIDEAFQYYEDRSDGLGSDFLRSVEATLASIERYPRMNAVIYRKARRSLLRRFPYALLYVIESEHISVLACTHVSRNPRVWRQRVRSNP